MKQRSDRSVVRIDCRWLQAAVFLSIALGWIRPTFAYLTFGDEFFGGMYLKWGDPTFGTGATVHWGFMADGTNGTAIDGVMGASNITQMRSTFDATYGAGQFDATISRALATWPAAANINFIYSPTDTGLPVNDPARRCRKFASGRSIQFPAAVSILWAPRVLRRRPTEARWKGMCCSIYPPAFKSPRAQKT